MILDIHKLIPIHKVSWDITKVSPFIYVLVKIDETTPRYRRENGKLLPDAQGTWIQDPGFDPLKRKPRILKYIGETINSWTRIFEHYHAGKLGRERKKQKGVGKVFTHVRIIKGLKRLQFDSVRVHEETRLVRKYLPELNKASQFTGKYLCIMLNSQGKISPWDLSYPYLIHGRDYYKAFLAWEKEDLSIIENDLIIPNNITKSGEPNMRRISNDFYRDGKKMRFHRFFKDIVIQRHIKQIDAMRQWRKNIRKWEQIYAPDFFKEKLERDRMYNRTNYRQRRKQFLLDFNETK